ncbi:tubulin delta chain-like [Mauremys reevesii]|uniref:tubulin delta chain-like n=1 Tax=Mauremys reevesii TaxID=260615 RepID=UPI00193FD8DB|nr:tubulin delta chain-like [Mauremys reevesii]
MAMSAVWLHVGQCGNQIGEEWWQILTSEKVPHAEADRYERISAICVDNEPNVVRKLQKRVTRGLDQARTTCTPRGLTVQPAEGFRCRRYALNAEMNEVLNHSRVTLQNGSVWAPTAEMSSPWPLNGLMLTGYHGLHSASERNLLGRTMESLRKEVECRDCYCGTVLFHSLSDGTGAGLSSRLCEAIRDEYSLGQILSVTVAPHQGGESPLQHYNSLLCLSWLQRHVDGVLLFQNDAVLRTTALLGKKVPASDMQPQVSLSAMNTYVTSCLAELLYPLKAFTTGRPLAGPEKLIVQPDRGREERSIIVPIVQVMGGKCSRWDRRTLPRQLGESSEGHPWICFALSLPCLQHYSTSVLAVACSYQEATFLLSRDLVLRKPKQAYRCVPWNPFPLRCWTDSLNIVQPGCHSHSLTVCANHSSSAELLQQVVARAEAMYKTNAYLHWYWRYGCEEEAFQQAFETLCSVADDYSRLGE